MTDNEKKIKSAFMALLASYRADIRYHVDDERTFCQTSCPLYDRTKNFLGDCSLGFLDQIDNDDDENDFDCDEAIFNWYMENADG